MLNLWTPFSDLAFTPAYDTPARFSPAVDVFEDTQALILRAEVPGVRAEDIEITVENNVLTLKGEKKAQPTRNRRTEQTYGTFTRRFHLPTHVDPAAIEAGLSDGILTVTLPKKPEVQPRKIEVKLN